VSSLTLSLLFQTVRTLGMVTCGENFNHQIMEKRTDTHKLVTTGVYRCVMYSPHLIHKQYLCI